MKKNYRNPIGVKKYTGLLLIMPFLLGFLLFTAYPFISSFLIGLTDYDGIRQINFVGTENYRRMLNDSDFLNAATVTLKYTAILVPMKLLFSLLTAIVLNMEIKGIGIYRTIFYIPSILGSNLAIVIMWQFLFTSDGMVNQFLEMAGLSSIGWYGDSTASMGIIVLLRLWEFGSTMIIFLNALRDIPKEYYEAAKVDGCGKIRSFFAITIPLLKNVIFLNFVLQIIAAMQEFNAPYMITGGGPMKSTYTLGMLLYDEMFRYHEVGYAYSLSWVMFIMIAVIVAVMSKFTGRFREDV